MVAPLTINAAPANVTAHPSKRRSVDMLAHEAAALLFTGSEVPTFASCIFRNSPPAIR
jgi:hypothetical protein